MSFAHHGSDDPNRNIEIANLLRRFEDQVEGRAKRAYSQGRISSTDDGDLACAIKADHEHGKIVMDFGKSVTWVAMSPEGAFAWAKVLIEKAREISKVPLVLEL